LRRWGRTSWAREADDGVLEVAPGRVEVDLGERERGARPGRRRLGGRAAESGRGARPGRPGRRGRAARDATRGGAPRAGSAACAGIGGSAGAPGAWRAPGSAGARGSGPGARPARLSRRGRARALCGAALARGQPPRSGACTGRGPFLPCLVSFELDHRGPPSHPRAQVSVVNMKTVTVTDKHCLLETASAAATIAAMLDFRASMPLDSKAVSRLAKIQT
jgi:hypothetical protein